VQLEKAGQSGTIKIQFSSPEELYALLQKMTAGQHAVVNNPLPPATSSAEFGTPASDALGSTTDEHGTGDVSFTV
jgi:hypothetical protein